MAAVHGASAGVLYQTGFGAKEGYVQGDISGQLGWTTFPAAGVASVTFTPPAGGSGGALAFSGGGAGNPSNSARYAWPQAYGSAFEAASAAGEVVLTNSTSIYVASGSSSTVRVGAATFDATGTRFLTGFFVQANTGAVTLIAYSVSGGTVNNFIYNTGRSIALNAWTTISTSWDRWTGRASISFVSTTGAFSGGVNGASVGSIADETDFVSLNNNSTTAATVFFDNLEVTTSVPAPGALSILGLAGVFGSRRRR